MTKSTPMGRLLLITAVVAVGIAAAWGTVAIWAVAMVERAMQSSNVYEQIYTSVDGEPVIVRMSRDARATERVLTLSGEPKQVSSQDLLYPHYVYGHDLPQFAGQGLDWVSRLVATTDGGVPPIYWYLVHDGHRPGRAYGIGYHSQTKTVVGYFGRHGFSDAMPPRDQWF